VLLSGAAPNEIQNGRDAMLGRLCTCVTRGLFAQSSLCLAQFAAVAICLATCCLQWVSLVGTSLPASLAVVAALTVGFAGGARRIAALRYFSLASFSSATLLPFALAAWMVGSPWLVQGNDFIISQPGVISLASPAWNGIVLFALALLMLGLPAFLAAQLATVHEVDSMPAARRLPFVFLGAAAGLTLWGIGLAQIMGPYYCGVSAAALGLIISVVRGRTIVNVGRETASIARLQSPVNSPINFEERPTAATARVLIECLSAIAVGGWIAVLDRLVGQLVASSIYLSCGEVIGLCVGFATGLSLAGRRREAGPGMKIAALCGLALWGVGVLAAYPLLIDAALWLNAYVATPSALLVARGTAGALALLPVGIAAAVWLAPQSGTASHWRSLRTGGWLVAAMLGYSALATWTFRHFSSATIVIGWAWLTLVAGASCAFLSRRTLLAGWPSRVALSAAVLVIVIAPLWRFNYNPQRSAKILFNSNVAYAYRAGLKPSLLMSIDEGRHIATLAGDRGEFTVWKYGGHQLQIRESGFPRGVISTDAESFPRYTPETLQVLLPCVLFGKVERALVLGLGSSESLSTAVAFPIPEIVCLETDAGLVDLVRDVISAQTGANPVDDERVTLVVCDPALGVAASRGSFDVIVSSPESLGLAQAQPYLTAEFYRRAARKLSPEGVFCQRLQCVDLGPQPIRTIVRTMQSVFRDVLAFESAPGELLLAATTEEHGLIRPGLTARLELPHVRALLGESGLDWTVMLNVGAVDQAGLEKFVGASSANTASAGRLPLSLPREMMRWAPKLEELHTALRPSSGRLLAWIGDEATAPVLVRRLAEVQGQQNLMTTYSDQYWAYRASLRAQVKDKPRSQIQQVGSSDDQKQMHPEDRRRLQYFATLGRAVKNHRAADIERLARFATPYDPLITFFVHQEAAELSSRSKDREFAQELRHRLHATYFASPRDASLRNVLAALALLREHPEAEADPACRWDDLNALLQALKMRWELRVGTRPSNLREAVDDIDTTVRAVEQTFQVLDQLTAEAGLPQDVWTARRSVLERTLIRPVRSYQQELLPLLHRRTEKSSDETKSIPE
jgi:hypothetical protein